MPGCRDTSLLGCGVEAPHHPLDQYIEWNIDFKRPLWDQMARGFYAHQFARQTCTDNRGFGDFFTFAPGINLNLLVFIVDKETPVRASAQAI